MSPRTWQRRLNHIRNWEDKRGTESTDILYIYGLEVLKIFKGFLRILILISHNFFSVKHCTQLEALFGIRLLLQRCRAENPLQAQGRLILSLRERFLKEVSFDFESVFGNFE